MLRSMYALTVSLLVTACVFAGGVAGVLLHPRLPPTHLTRETHDVVKLGIGMVSVLASLVLGLLIATAKGSSDNTDRDIRGYAADIIVLAETLRDYGATAATPIDLLRQFTGQTLRDVWPEDDAAPILADPRTGQMLEHVREAIRALRPVDNGQHWLQDQALTLVTSLLRQRWQIIEHQGPNVRPIVLAILVSWITFIFGGFGLNAPRNATVMASFLVCSMAIGGSVFLIIEMDNPFQGILRISRAPMENALAQMRQTGPFPAP
jgi:hypothetical protein